MAEESGAPDRSSSLHPAILLVDMDSFFASVEVRADPSLRGRPVLVGGSAKRGVVASCSYEARRFGVHSAMAMVTAMRLCPDAVVLDVDMAAYAQVSRQIHRIFRDVTPLVEPLALDEAFLDVTGAIGLIGSPRAIAHLVRARIQEELELDCAVGVGPSKLVAKLASKRAKPTIVDGSVTPGEGVVVIMPDEVRPFLDELDVRALFGVGPATAKSLERLGIERVSELARMDPELLVRHLGRAQAHGLVALARGEDDRAVVPDQVAKSIGHEETFAEDVSDIEILVGRLRRQAVAVSGALHEAGRRGRTVSVKAKDAQFRTRTRSHTLGLGIDDHVAIFTVATALLEDIDVFDGIRLLGLSISNLEDATEPVQLRLDVDGGEDNPEAQAEQLQQGREALEEAVDEIRARFGRHVLGTASALGRQGLKVPAQRDAPYGPASSDQGSGAIQEP
jgi:DNA polymerase-4